MTATIVAAFNASPNPTLPQTYALTPTVTSWTPTPTLVLPTLPRSTPMPTDDSPQVIVVTRDDRNLPSGCTPRDIAQFIIRFFDAFNHGDLEQLSDLVFGTELYGITPSQWYFVNPGNPGPGERHFVAYKLNTALNYFAERHKQGEHLRLLTVRLNGGIGWQGGVNIEYYALRQAEDLPASPDHLAFGKGALDCQDQQKIRAWGMSSTFLSDPQQITSVKARLCPPPSADSPFSAVVACNSASE